MLLSMYGYKTETPIKKILKQKCMMYHMYKDLFVNIFL